MFGTMFPIDSSYHVLYFAKIGHDNVNRVPQNSLNKCDVFNSRSCTIIPTLALFVKQCHVNFNHSSPWFYSAIELCYSFVSYPGVLHIYRYRHVIFSFV